jgi:hypothetical protein
MVIALLVCLTVTVGEEGKGPLAAFLVSGPSTFSIERTSLTATQ